MMDVGYHPGEWVRIVRHRLSKDLAKKIEQELIKQHQPRFNQQMGLGALKITRKLVEEVRKDRSENGTYYGALGPKFGCSPMTAYRICTQEVRTID